MNEGFTTTSSSMLGRAAITVVRAADSVVWRHVAGQVSYWWCDVSLRDVSRQWTEITSSSSLVPSRMLHYCHTLHLHCYLPTLLPNPLDVRQL